MKKTAVITGAGGVLCSAFAKALAADGWRVALLDLNKEAAQKYAEEICATGGEAVALYANVLEKESLQAAADAVCTAFGPCDLLINGAGGNNPRGTTASEVFDEMDPERLEPAVLL